MTVERARQVSAFSARGGGVDAGDRWCPRDPGGSYGAGESRIASDMAVFTKPFGTRRGGSPLRSGMHCRALRPAIVADHVRENTATPHRGSPSTADCQHRRRGLRADSSGTKLVHAEVALKHEHQQRSRRGTEMRR